MDILDSTIIEFDLSNRRFKEISLEELSINSEDTNKIYWIHSNLNQIDQFKKIAKKLSLSDDVIKLCGQDDIIPKLIDSDDSLSIQIQNVLPIQQNDQKEIIFSNLILHLTDRFCFTASSEPVAALFELIASFQKALRFAKTPCFILFLLFDIIVNDYAKVLFHFELITDQMDTKARIEHHNTYNEVMDIKQQVMKVKRYTIAAREILVRLSSRNISVVSDQCRESLYNLSNHSHMVINEADSIRDMLNDLLDQIDNTLMQKLNETMRVLTAFAAIFLPLSLITGIYGMNFHWIPELSWKYGYFYAIGLILFCGIGLYMLFKKKKWI